MARAIRVDHEVRAALDEIRDRRGFTNYSQAIRWAMLRRTNPALAHSTNAPSYVKESS